ncbi:MAG TPA: AMP-binding protein, partial [Blastocatellia bacterium]|nr:AMP-binding protein [Blastocatellia bacterium]
MGTVLKRSGSAYASKPWLGSYDFWVPATVPYPKQPVYRALEIGAANFPDRAATMFFGAEMSFRELRDRALRMATALRGFGISKGDRVGIMLPNCPQFPISFFGVLRAGATVVSINPTYTPREVERLAQDSGIRMLIVMDLIAASLVGSIANSRIENVVVTPLHSYMPDAVAARYVSERESQIPTVDSLRRGIGGLPGNHPAFHGFDEIIQSTQPEHFQADVGPDDIAALQYTGGTTGTPKGAMLTHHNLFANTIQSVVWRSFFASPEGERALMVIPLFHVYGMTIGMLLGALQGSTLILIPKFDADLLLDAIARYKPTFFPAVPTLYVALLNHPRSKGTDFSSVRYFNSGSAPLPLDVVERFEQMTGSLIRQGYGLSETSPTTHSTPQLGPRKPESCGIPFPDTECKIVDLETGEQEMPVNELGEVCIRGPQVMKGYWNQQEETARALRPDPHG